MLFIWGLRDVFKKKDVLPKKMKITEDYKIENIIHRKITEDLWLHSYYGERFLNCGKIDTQLLCAGIDDEKTIKYLLGLTVFKEANKLKIR